MADIAELIVALKLRDGVSPGLGRLNSQLKGMQGGLSQVNRGIGQVGTGLDRAITRGAVAAGGAIAFVVHSAVEFEDAFTGVAKTVDASAAELAGLSDEIRAMSREMPIAATELAGIAEQAGALGVAVADIEEFTRVAALIGVTTDVTSDQAATALGQLSNVLGLTGDDFERFASTLVDLGNKGASTESQILEIATRAGAAGDLIGLSADQVLAFASAAANLGIEAEAGGSAIQKFFIDTLTNIQDEDLLGVMARTAGETGVAFKQAFEKDAAGALDVFLQGLGKLDEAAQIETLQTLGFNDVRITRLLLGLANNTDNLTDSLNTAHDAFAANTAIQDEAERKFANTASQLKILTNNITDAAVTVGNELLPVITELSKEFVGFLNEPGTQAGIREFATDLAEGVRGLAAELKGTDFSGIISGLQITAQIAKTAFDAFRALPEPLQQLAVAAFAVNKISGGALGSIAAGLGNILLGSLKTITAGNVTVIGARVTGPGGPGLPAAPGGGGGFLGGLAGGLAVGTGVAAAGVATAMVVDFGVRASQQVQGINNRLDELPRSTADELDDSIAKVESAIHTATDGPLAAIVSNSTGLTQRLDAELEELQATKLQQQANATEALQADHILLQNNITAEGRRYTQAREALSADTAMANSAAQQRQVQISAIQEHTRIANAALSSDQAMLQTARTQSGQLSTATGLLGSINSKPFSTDITLNNYNTVSVNASVIEQRLTTERLIASGNTGAAGQYTIR